MKPVGYEMILKKYSDDSRILSDSVRINFPEFLGKKNSRNSYFPGVSWRALATSNAKFPFRTYPAPEK